MTRRGLRLPDVLDDASQLVTLVAAPWVGVLWLTALPVRLLQADFAAQLIELGAEARDYGDHLTELATLVFVAFVVSLAGRALFVHACYLRLHSRAADSARTLRLPVAGTFCYFYAAILIEALFYLLAFSLVAVPVLCVAAGLAAAMIPSVKRVRIASPFRELGEPLSFGWVLAGLVGICGIGLGIAYVNLYYLSHLGLWLAGGLPGVDSARWAVLLGGGNPRYPIALVVGATLAVEPFWLAALVVVVHRARSRRSGEDLRLWFEALKAES